ncbi:MAG: PorV/PorQ family protein [Candidatus Marinimicrobia bacterium]|nr:PorV/PorQ family protein [Candidatus Neomarinimicrobiota bacterium]MBL7047650.1 PorV/PorQ family protein [Candidatus Neomarinimicrobiota bacterium]
MKKKHYISFIFCLLFINLSVVQTQSVSKVGTTAGQFLKIGVGSRALAMGGAFAAIASDASALYWNPAGISRTKNNHVLFDHTNWFLDINFEFVGTTFHLGSIGTIGASISYLHMDEMLVTTTHDPEGETGQTFKAGSYSACLTFAKNLTDRFSLGINTKYINEFIYNSSASGFAVDIGTLYKTRLDGLTLGMSISNFGTKMQMNGRDLLIQTDLDPTLESDPEHINAYLATDRFDLPLLFRFGLAYNFPIFYSGLNITVAADANHPNDNTESLNIGTEINIMNFVFLRGGLHNLYQRDSEEKFTLGAGVNISVSGIKWGIDYSYHEFERLSNPQKISLSLTY